MADRRWTVLVVPHGSESPRSIAISRRLLKLVSSGAAAIALFAALGFGMLLSGFVRPGEGGFPDSASAAQELIELRGQVAALQDTLFSLERRDEQLRLLAGLSTPSDSPDVAIPEAGDSAAARGFGLTAVRSTRANVEALLRKATGLLSSFAEISDTLQRNAARMESTPSIMPTAGWLSSHFSLSRRHPLLHEARPHEGIDVTAPMGAPIVAPASGRVSVARRESGYGLMVEIDHGNGIVTRYAHCSRMLVRPGQQVTRGQVIALVGNTGLSTGPHLHYEIHVNGRVVDPLSYVLPGGTIAD